MEINQYDITIATHYEITMVNSIARGILYEIMMGDIFAIHCDVTMSNNVIMLTCQCITLHNDVSVILFYYELSAVCLMVSFCYK